MKKLLWLIPLFFLTKAEAATTGEYVNFGDFLGENVTYYIAGCEDINQDGTLDYLLFSEKILTHRAFDQSTNRWSDSGLREWLNSESGFLSEENFSSAERERILPVKRKTILPGAEHSEGGNEMWRWNDGGNTDWRNALENYDTAYYETAQDLVVIPSVGELVRYQVPTWIMAGEPTVQSGEGLGWTKCAFSLRDAVAGSTDSIRFYYEYNSISASSVSNSALGIRPMLWLDGKSVLLGKGSSASPYYLQGSWDEPKKNTSDMTGKYLNFGSYRGEPICFYISSQRDINGDGKEDYQLFSANVLMYKAFDPETNIWGKSALRTWLNSREQNVTYSGKSPAEGNVLNNSYDTEPGFLSETNFSKQEFERIIPVTNKSAYPQSYGADGGSEAWRWNDGNYTNWRLALQNYDNVYYNLSEDYVSIPSVKDLAEMESLLLFADPAKTAGANQSGTKYGFLFRDATWNSNNAVRYYAEYNSIHSTSVRGGLMGVRPMLWIDGNTVFAGVGEKDSPFYVIGEDGAAMYLKTCTKTVTNKKTIYSAKVKSYTPNDRNAMLIAAVYENNGLKKIYTSQKTLTYARSKTISVEVPIEETGEVRIFYWDEAMMPLSVREASETEERLLVYQNDFTFRDDNIAMSDCSADKAFDDNPNTVFGIGNLETNDIVFHFQYPAEIRKISLQSVSNGDWAMAKNVQILAYDDENIYRKNTKNPIYITTIALEKNGAVQEFILPENELLSDITHLVLRITDTYRFPTNAVWGGFTEIKMYGTLNTKELPVSETVNANIWGNREIAWLFGVDLPRGKISRTDAARALSQLVITAYRGSETLSGDEFYSMFTDRESFIKSGIGMLWGISEMTGRDLGIGLLEAMRVIGIPQSLPENAREHLEDKIDTLSAANIGTPSKFAKDANGEFSFTRSTEPKLLQETNFCYNAPFHYAGIYYGVKPETDPLSTRKDFKEALSTAGTKSLRFPGGLPCHQYFIEGEEKTAELYNMTEANKGGLYNPNDSNNRYYTDFYEFLDFCEESNIEPIFQVNTSFYVDPDTQKIHAICKNWYMAEPDGTYKTELYDRDRFEEAAESFGKNIDKMLAAGHSIKYWEFGNEDFATLNYLKTDLTAEGNPAEDNYVKIVTLMIRVLKEKIPDAVIIATGGFPNLEEKLLQAGVLEDVDYISSHYPFAYWITPDAANKNDLTTLLEKNEMGFVTNSNVSTGNKLCTTETSVWRFESWDAGVMQNTFAMALNTAHQWGELLFETPWKISVLHDLESPFFGFVLYDMKFNPQNRWLLYSNSELATEAEDVPEDYNFLKSYHVTPAAKAVKILGNHCGGAVLDPGQTSEFSQVSVFCSERDGKITVTAVNKLSEAKPISISFSNITLPGQTVQAEVLSSENIGAILEREYQTEQTSISVSPGSSLNITLKPYSIYQFVLAE